MLTTPTMPRPPKQKPDEPGMLFLRNMRPETIAALDEWVEKLNKGNPGPWTRTSLARAVLDRAVPQMFASGESP